MGLSNRCRAQHIASAGDLQAAIPRTDLLGSVGNREISAHILDLCTLEPCLGNHLYRRSVRRIKHQHTGGKAGKGALHQITKGSFHKKTRRTHPVLYPRKVSICLTAFALRFYLFLLKPASSRYSGCSFTYGSWSPQMV